MEVTYTSHHYTLGGRIYRQPDGGPQGVDTVVEVAEVYMLSFDRRFLAKLRRLGIKVFLYQRYVDDITIQCPAFNPGWGYNSQ